MHQTPQPLNYLFAYGTLMTGHRRQHVWPHPPESIEEAWIAGFLVDLGPYPALLLEIPHEFQPDTQLQPHRIRGQLWAFPPDTWLPTLTRLDAVEGFANQPDDLYRRTTTLAHPLDANQPVPCQTYAYFAPLPPHTPLIQPNPDGWVRWSKSAHEEG